MSYPANKVKKIKDACEEHGWDFSEEVYDDNNPFVHTLVACKRDQEVITMEWQNQRMVNPPMYTIAGSVTILHNAKAALARIAGEPDVEKLNKRGKPVIRGRLTLSADSADDEILKTLAGRRITWLSEAFNDPLSTRVLAKNATCKHYKIVRNGRVRVEFIDEFGFRSVHLDKIVGIR